MIDHLVRLLAILAVERGIDLTEDAIRTLLGRRPPSAHRERIAALAAEGLTAREIAAVTGLPLGTVRRQGVGLLTARGARPIEVRRPDLVDEVRRLSAEGRTAEEIAVALDVSSPTVGRLRRDHGIPGQRRGRKPAK